MDRVSILLSILTGVAGVSLLVLWRQVAMLNVLSRLTYQVAGVVGMLLNQQRLGESDELTTEHGWRGACTRPGHHKYLSTACLHAVIDPRPELHEECETSATRWDGTPKVATQCKYCETRCLCPCHGKASAEAPA